MDSEEPAVNTVSNGDHSEQSAKKHPRIEQEPSKTETNQEECSEPAPKRSKPEPSREGMVTDSEKLELASRSANCRVLFVLTHEVLGDDYNPDDICDFEETIGIYPSHQLALMYKYQKMVDIINEAIKEYNWWCIDELPSYIKRNSNIEDVAILRKLYEHFFVECIAGDEEEEEDEKGDGGERAKSDSESESIWLELNLASIRECLSSLTTATAKSNESRLDFEENDCHLGYNFSDLFDFLFQCHYRSACMHGFSIRRQSCSPTATTQPELFCTE